MIARQPLPPSQLLDPLKQHLNWPTGAVQHEHLFEGPEGIVQAGQEHQPTCHEERSGLESAPILGGLASSSGALTLCGCFTASHRQQRDRVLGLCGEKDSALGGGRRESADPLQQIKSRSILVIERKACPMQTDDQLDP